MIFANRKELFKKQTTKDANAQFWNWSLLSLFRRFFRALIKAIWFGLSRFVINLCKSGENLQLLSRANKAQTKVKSKRKVYKLKPSAEQLESSQINHCKLCVKAKLVKFRGFRVTHFCFRVLGANRRQNKLDSNSNSTFETRNSKRKTQTNAQTAAALVASKAAWGAPTLLEFRLAISARKHASPELLHNFIDLRTTKASYGPKICCAIKPRFEKCLNFVACKKTLLQTRLQAKLFVLCGVFLLVFVATANANSKNWINDSRHKSGSCAEISTQISPLLTIPQASKIVRF